MEPLRKTARFVGALFLIAMAASLAGGGLVESAISAPDAQAAIVENSPLLIAGLLLELTNAVAVAGIGILMYPILGRFGDNMARGYLGFRIIEAVFCSAIVIGPLALMYIGRSMSEVDPINPEYANALGMLALAQRASIADLLIPLYFGLGALVLYISMYQVRFLPRFIAIWGLIAVVGVLTMTLLTLFAEIPIGLALVLVLPIILNEVFMGIWLIVKGFDPRAFPTEQRFAGDGN